MIACSYLGSRRPSPRKKHLDELMPPEDAPDLPKREERNERNKQHNHACAELIRAHVKQSAPDARPVLFVEQPLDEVFERAEQDRKHSKEHRFAQDGQNQRSAAVEL